jgi:hypothetical protein
VAALKFEREQGGQKHRPISKKTARRGEERREQIRYIDLKKFDEVLKKAN